MGIFIDRRKNAARGAAAGTEAPAKAGRAAGGRYTERDNRGSRQESMAQALAYWKKERPTLPVQPPFTLFTFPSAEAAEKAMLALPFIHKAADSGKLICERRMTFGYYEILRRGAPTGQFEALVTGSDLTRDEFRLAEAAFADHEGRCKMRCAPAAGTDAEIGNAALVRYSQTLTGSDGLSIYEVYNGPDKASAQAFLREKTVKRRYYYLVVDTPEGSFGRDAVGLYQE